MDCSRRYETKAFAKIRSTTKGGIAMEFALTHPDTGIKEILVLFDGVPYEANSDHPWWDEIIRLCLADDERVLDLFPIRPV
jgi:hypothetical protein